MKEILEDIIKHINVVPSITDVLVKIDGKQTLIDTFIQQSIVIQGSTKKPVKEFTGSFGLSRLGYLNGLITHPNFKTPSSKVEVVSNVRNGQETPEELLFTDDKGQQWSYRFMSASLMKSSPTFIGKKWDIELVPEPSRIREFLSFAKLVSSYENFFSAKVVNGQLRFYMGDENGANDKGFIIFADDIDAKFETVFHWPLGLIIPILSLAFDEQVTVRIITRGIINIHVETENMIWDYYISATQGR